jgi:hypothetical protein
MGQEGCMEPGVRQALLGRTPFHRMTLSFTAWTFLSVPLHEMAASRASKLEAGSRRVPILIGRQLCTTISGASSHALPQALLPVSGGSACALIKNAYLRGYTLGHTTLTCTPTVPQSL